MGVLLALVQKAKPTDALKSAVAFGAAAGAARPSGLAVCAGSLRGVAPADASRDPPARPSAAQGW